MADGASGDDFHVHRVPPDCTPVARNVRGICCSILKPIRQRPGTPAGSVGVAEGRGGTLSTPTHERSLAFKPTKSEEKSAHPHYRQFY